MLLQLPLLDQIRHLRTAKDSFSLPPYPLKRSGTYFSLSSRLLQLLFPQALCCKGWKVQSPKPVIRKARRSLSDPISAPGSAQSRKLTSNKSYRGEESQGRRSATEWSDGFGWSLALFLSTLFATLQGGVLQMLNDFSQFKMVSYFWLIQLSFNTLFAFYLSSILLILP